MTKRTDESTSKPQTERKAKQVSSNKHVYIERRPEGDYAVRRANSERASDVLPTQRQAIERARELSPDGRLHVERVRKTSEGTPDRWRKLK
ncbi:DUF2188 domain-containing protein [Bradyrhizobium commune]|uniref:DUF2188 domain-containing protein n=1 Tax=Bradyrhizobium commune TaxID=83627 RepID=A0A7S9H3W2_9BRAD|nr:DUF2188 domain-containing protein [Bradyrhizobium commune]